MKKLCTIFLVITLILVCLTPVCACDEKQTSNYTTRIIIGDKALDYKSEECLNAILDAVYLCCEQHDNFGQEKIDNLKKIKVFNLPTISEINLSNNDLLKCMHNSWEYECPEAKKAQASRKQLLRKTVSSVLDFDLVDSSLNKTDGKCNSFSALLYYAHILCDYLSDEPESTTISISGKTVPAYSGKPYIELNGNVPSFTSSEKRNVKSFAIYSPLQQYGRCGVAFANISTDNMAPPGSRQHIGNIKPSGWEMKKYPGLVNSTPAYMYNRCHLIAHQLNGNDTVNNLITGTRYLNEDGMKPFEDDVAKYIRSTGNHVLYRATPIYKGDNLVASGVQLEAYSVEDAGVGISFNVYCYNVQPGVSINYASGKTKQADTMLNKKSMIPFAVYNPDDSNPDLIYEMNKHLEILFEDQKTSHKYISMMSEINSIAAKARAVGDQDENEAKRYMKLKGYEYEYLTALQNHIPALLKEESFFTLI